MRMKITRDTIIQGLGEIIRPEDEVVVIHSGLWSFGAKMDVPPDQVAQVVLEAVRSAVGPNRTLFMPTFTFSFCRTGLFDLDDTPSETGALTQAFLDAPDTIRTASAINSFAASGPMAEQAAGMQAQTLWGENTLWHWFEQKNVCICSLGLPILRAISIAHRAEEAAQVPYRYFKTFTGTWKNGDKVIEPWEETMYVRALCARFDYQKVCDALYREQAVLQADGPVLLESTHARDIMQATLSCLDADPYAFVLNRCEVKKAMQELEETSP